MQTVHVRINDAGTGQPTPCRVRFTDEQGAYYPPLGRLADFSVHPNRDVGGTVLYAEKQYAYIDGTCEIQLPAGLINLEVHKGPEYRPLIQPVDLPPGKLSLRFDLLRWLDARQEQWYSGDVRAHFLSPHAALLEGAAEDLAVVNLLAMPWNEEKPSLPNLLAFSGQDAALERPGHVVVVNTLNIADERIALGLLNCHRVVYPLTFAAGSGPIDWTLADWCDQCHRKNGFVFWSDFELESSWDTNQVVPGEAFADVILGRIDALEVNNLSWCSNGLEAWYRFLHAGFPIPLVGGSGKTSNAHLLGGIRTYVRLHANQSYSYPPWIEAMRAGRTFATNGPLLSFSVNGCDAGAVLDVPAGTKTVHVSARARSQVRFDRLEIIADGEVIANTRAIGEPAVAAIEEDFPLQSSGWWAARCWGQTQVPCGAELQPIAAHTSAIFVNLQDSPWHENVPYAGARGMLRERLGQLQRAVEQDARFATSRDRDRLARILENAHEELGPAKLRVESIRPKKW